MQHSPKKQQALYSGKAKTVFTTDDPEHLIIEFRDDTSAYDGEKVEQLARKGEINNKFTDFIMGRLAAAGISTHHVARLNDTEALVKKLDMIPVEAVVRNLSTGSLVRRLGVEEGIEFSPPTFEFFLKNDALHDPMVNESLILAFGWATQAEIAFIKAQTFKVNDVLKPLFADAGLLLVDYKLEFGRFDGGLLLGDEFTPDGCRLWDAKTRKKLDKDRFRQGLGGVIEGYLEVCQRLGISI